MPKIMAAKCGPLQTAPLVRRIWGAVRLIHAFPVAVVVATSLALIVLAYRGLPSPATLFRAALVVLLTQIPVGAIND